ncbi:DUF1002 domain-containing protein [Fictibacillus phosphorivorans]|uniref:DUF1002 domain-containing protein n=1 Tax=Fictibacillus phosphorivorans TaxID=1221500 RepID=UPI00203A7EC8|nr:DUF1002 domain-containing protein [Fictibacillus phosphorivorans]MCM3716832.1 DUF1002 domain-containing protein [Fictibacillus phosphorivorans]MCM3774619.1 DUF1002 domain-containing protein [Fictibacillus phosphorivorans]
MKKAKIFALLSIMAAALFIAPLKMFADAAPGDIIVTLGQNLTEEQKNTVLKEMDVPADVQTVTVTNEEEHKYLGDYISKAQIGSKAISSSKITIGEKDQGLSVETNNINWVTEEMYMNALTTAGVTDAEIYVTAPFEVSGTAALTGILKAYETTAQIEIPEAQKQVANEEMVKTAELGERIGTKEATELMTRVKEEIAKNPVQSEEDLRALIEKVAKDMGIKLTQEELNGLIALFNKMKDLNIDWDQLQSDLKNISENLGDFLNKEETQSFIQKILEFLSAIIEAIKSLFK